MHKSLFLSKIYITSQSSLYCLIKRHYFTTFNDKSTQRFLFSPFSNLSSFQIFSSVNIFLTNKTSYKFFTSSYSIPQLIINDQIPYPFVRIIDDEGWLGDMTPMEGISLAQKRKKSLVLILPNASPPLCKIVAVDEYLASDKSTREELYYEQIISLPSDKLQSSLYELHKIFPATSLYFPKRNSGKPSSSSEINQISSFDETTLPNKYKDNFSSNENKYVSDTSNLLPFSNKTISSSTNSNFINNKIFLSSTLSETDNISSSIESTIYQKEISILNSKNNLKAKESSKSLLNNNKDDSAIPPISSSNSFDNFSTSYNPQLINSNDTQLTKESNQNSNKTKSKTNLSPSTSNNSKNFQESEFTFDPSCPVRNIRLNGNCEQNDLIRKINQCRQFLLKGNRIQIDLLKPINCSAQKIVECLKILCSELTDISRPINLPVASSQLDNTANTSRKNSNSTMCISIKFWPCTPEYAKKFQFPNWKYDRFNVSNSHQDTKQINKDKSKHSKKQAKK